MSRRTSGENGLFIVLVLLAVEVWAHKSFMTKAGHYILLACLVGGAIPIGAVIFKFIKKVNRWRLHKYNPNMSTIDNMTGLEFEHYIARLLKVRDFSHIKLTEEYDYGIDIIATKNGITWGIQVKRYSGLVKADAVRQAVTALKKYHCDRAMVISNSTYSEVVKGLARSNECVLIDRSILSRWAAK